MAFAMLQPATIRGVSITISNQQLTILTYPIFLLKSSMFQDSPRRSPRQRRATVRGVYLLKFVYVNSLNRYFL